MTRFSRLIWLLDPSISCSYRCSCMWQTFWERCSVVIRNSTSTKFLCFSWNESSSSKWSFFSRRCLWPGSFHESKPSCFSCLGFGKRWKLWRWFIGLNRTQKALVPWINERLFQKNKKVLFTNISCPVHPINSFFPNNR